MDDEIVRMFQEDTRESLADIEADLLDIEEAGQDFDPELVNKVFRAAHTIKGSASFLSLNSVRDLAHKIENVLDMIRNMEIDPQPEVVSIVLTAFDTLGAMVENVAESESMDVSGQIRELTTLVSAGLPPERQQTLTTERSITLPDGRPVFDISEHNLHQARKGGNYLYLVEYDLIHDVHYKDKTPFELLGFLEKSGLILDCKLDVAAVGDLTGPPTNRIPLYILYASILEPDMVRAVLQVEREFIHLITPEEERAAAVTNKAEAAQESGEPLWSPTPVSQGQSLQDMEREFDAALERLEAGGKTEQQAGAGKSAGPEAQAFAANAASEELEGFTLLVDKDQAKLVLSGDLSIERGKEVRAALLQVLDRFTRVILEFADVDSVDLACLQMLVAAFRSGKDKGVALSCAGDSLGKLQAVSQRAGFTPEIASMYGLDDFLPLA